MIRAKEERKYERQVIDLQGPDGNAYVLMGTALGLSRQMGYDETDRENLMSEMTAGDYEQLIEVFDNHFGHIIDLQK